MIQLRKIRLINWYAFSCITAPCGRFTLIAGRNGNGKSVLLDAIKYALYGDTVFNKSTENKGSRTLSSYTRGLLDATAGSYIRPADKMPNIYTHIALEMYEPELERSFVLGTVLETNSANGITTQRYVMEGKTLGEIEHTYADGEYKYPYSASQLQQKYGLRMYSAMDGLKNFMQRTGLRLNEVQLAAFKRKLRSIMSYDPNAKIDQFIRNNVLEEKNVDFSKLVETKTNIDKLTNMFAVIDTEIKELEQILAQFEELKRAKRNLFLDDVKLAYRQLLNCTKKRDEALKNIGIARRQLEDDEKKLEIISSKEKELNKALNMARNNLDALDCARAINEAEEALTKAKEMKEELYKEKQSLLEFQDRISELMSWFNDEGREVTDREILSSLTLASYSKAEKGSSVDAFRTDIENYKEDIIGEIALIKQSQKSNNIEQTKCQKLIDDCESKKTSFFDIPDYVALKNEINRRFAAEGIQSEARFACEYVKELSDESWRDVIEGYLGRRRYTILVEPDYYDIADDVLNHSKNRYAHLFNTKLLMKKDVAVEEDSVAHFIDIKNPVARKYFDYQLGRFHAADIGDVKKYENAMSKEGRVAVAMDSYFIDFDRIRSYYLGQETIELNLQKAQRKMEALKNEYFEYERQMKDYVSKKEYLETELKLFGEYNYDACSEYDAVLVECEKKEKELAELKKAQKNNMEWLQLSQQVASLEDELKAIVRERDSVLDDKSKQNTTINLNNERYDEAEDRIAKSNDSLHEYELQNNVDYKKARDDYDKYLAAGETGLGGVLKDRNRAENRHSAAKNDLISRLSAYNAVRKDVNLPMTEDSEAEYRARKNKIWVSDRETVDAELKEQNRRYGAIFKNEFVLTVLKSCENARSELKKINGELSRLKFKSTYEFDVNYVKDGSDYEKILEYARYLKERESLGTADGQLTLDTMTSYSNDKGEEIENEIKKIIDKITGSNDKELIENYADYRNYMTYEILLSNDILNKAKLSRQSGYNSGAEVQIPYMLILLSALLMIYNDKINSTRLVFIDEPFAKMDPSNVKIMLDFMKSQNLQMIFCAPDKIEVIGNECEVILPVLRDKPDLMEIGTVEFHKGV